MEEEEEEAWGPGGDGGGDAGAGGNGKSFSSSSSGEGGRGSAGGESAMEDKDAGATVPVYLCAYECECLSQNPCQRLGSLKPLNGFFFLFPLFVGARVYHAGNQKPLDVA